MTIKDIEGEALKLLPRERARLAERLLESLEDLSEAENEQLWAEEAERRDKGWDSNPSVSTPADEVFRDARSKLSGMNASAFINSRDSN